VVTRVAWTSDRYVQYESGQDVGLRAPCFAVVSGVCLPGLHVAAGQWRLMSVGLPGKQGRESLGSLVRLMPRACPLASWPREDSAFWPGGSWTW